MQACASRRGEAGRARWMARASRGKAGAPLTASSCPRCTPHIHRSPGRSPLQQGRSGNSLEHVSVQGGRPQFHMRGVGEYAILQHQTGSMQACVACVALPVMPATSPHHGHTPARPPTAYPPTHPCPPTHSPCCPCLPTPTPTLCIPVRPLPALPTPLTLAGGALRRIPARALPAVGCLAVGHARLGGRVQVS